MSAAPKPEVGTMTTREQAAAARQSAAVAREPKTPREKLKVELAKFAPGFEALLPDGYSAERLITGALVAATRNEALYKCNPVSVATALATVAQWGLDVGYTAHLVPFGSDCTPVPDYKGFIELMTAAGALKVEAHVVRQDDTFDYRLGTDPYLQHVPKGGSVAPIVAAYAVVWLRGGVTQFEVVPRDEIEAVRAKSRSWAKGELPSWYARKTAIRRLAKYVGKSPQLRAVLHAEAVDLGEAEADAAMLARLEAATGEAQNRIRIPGPSAVPDAGYDEPTPPSERITGRGAGTVETVVVDMARKPKERSALADQPDAYGLDDEMGDAAE